MLFSIRPVRLLGPRVISRRFTAAASAPTSKTQVYISRSPNPYLNLSIEHHLLQNTPADSTVLFLYTNRPCVVIGRNQNPWLEVNLPLLRDLNSNEDVAPTAGPIELVRRRSGGGTVFHDQGNVNYSVICPPASFDRDKHAEMVVRALRSLGVEGADVNCRHDIVLNVPAPSSSSSGTPDEAGATQSCAATNPSHRPGTQTFKISGSAYKLTRLRSLHHGTCLLSSPNLENIGPLLRSPAEPFIKARGVESVRSPVRNVGVGNDAFEQAVVGEFWKMYGPFDIEKAVGEEEAGVEKVAKGMSELQSRDWIYGQTPLFSFSTHPTEDDARERPAFPGMFHLSLEARHGQIQKFALGSASAGDPEQLGSLHGSKVYDVTDWSRALEKGGVEKLKAAMLGGWLDELFRTA